MNLRRDDRDRIDSVSFESLYYFYNILVWLLDCRNTQTSEDEYDGKRHHNEPCSFPGSVRVSSVDDTLEHIFTALDITST